MRCQVDPVDQAEGAGQQEGVAGDRHGSGNNSVFRFPPPTPRAQAIVGSLDLEISTESSLIACAACCMDVNGAAFQSIAMGW